MMQKYLSLFLLVGVIVISTLTIQNIALQQEALSISSGVKVPSYTPTESPAKTTPSSVSTSPSTSIIPVPTANPNTIYPSQPAPTGELPNTQPVHNDSQLPRVMLTVDIFRYNPLGNDIAEVKALQQFLMSGGFLGEGNDTGYFGPLTETAVVAFQTANNITPTMGYVGPKTRQVINGVIGAVAERPNAVQVCNCHSAGPNGDDDGTIQGNHCYASDCWSNPPKTN